MKQATKTLKQWCIKNDRQDVLDAWDYELNQCSPEDVSWSSSNKYFFKCLKHQEHKSELKEIWSSITKRNSAITCIQCKSVAQYILDNFPDKDLYDVWDKDKNGDLDPWRVGSGSNKKIWIKCQEKDYHGSYNPVVNNFTNGSRCTYCTNKKGMVHPLDSFGQYVVNNYGEDFLNSIWSDKNKKSPFEYAKGSKLKVWWKSLDNSMEDFKREIYSSVVYGFRNPRVLNRLTTKEAATLTQEQMDKGFNIGDKYREFVKKCIERALGYYKKDCMGIYKIYNTINNKVYIGQAVNIEDRWVEHIYSSLSKNRDEYNYPLYNAFRKYGIGNFNFEILEECDVEELDDKEIYYINHYNSNLHNPNSHGYNQTDGGYAIRGWRMSDEQKKKQSKTMKEKCKKGDYDHLKKIVVCEDKEFKSAKECSIFYNVNYQTMTSWLNHCNDMPKKWYNKGLRYKDETMDDYKISEVEIRRVICEEIAYDNITECAKHYDVDPKLLSQYLNKVNNMPETWYERGLHFEGEQMKDYKISTKNKKVICDGIVFNSIKECAKHYKVNPATMQYWLKKHAMPQGFVNKGLKYYKK